MAAPTKVLVAPAASTASASSSTSSSASVPAAAKEVQSKEIAIGEQSKDMIVEDADDDEDDFGVGVDD